MSNNTRYEVHTTYVLAPEVPYMHPITYKTLEEAEKFVSRLYEIGHAGLHTIIERSLTHEEQ